MGGGRGGGVWLAYSTLTLTFYSYISVSRESFDWEGEIISPFPVPVFFSDSLP